MEGRVQGMYAIQALKAVVHRYKIIIISVHGTELLYVKIQAEMEGRVQGMHAIQALKAVVHGYKIIDGLY